MLKRLAQQDPMVLFLIGACLALFFLMAGVAVECHRLGGHIAVEGEKVTTCVDDGVRRVCRTVPAEGCVLP